MKTIKELEAEFEEWKQKISNHSIDWGGDIILTKTETLKDVLGLIDELKHLKHEYLIRELKRRITGEW